jgi:hypothetical protein
MCCIVAEADRDILGRKADERRKGDNARFPQVGATELPRGRSSGLALRRPAQSTTSPKNPPRNLEPHARVEAKGDSVPMAGKTSAKPLKSARRIPAAGDQTAP